MKEKKRIGHDDRINLQTKVELFFSRINSYVRGPNENRTPYDLMAARFGGGFMEAIGVKRIPAKDVLLKPSLLKSTHRRFGRRAQTNERQAVASS